MSIAMVGFSIGGTILSPIIGNLTTSQGQRSTYKAVGITRLVILVPLVLFVIRRIPVDMGTKAYGVDEEGETGKARKIERERNASLKEVEKKPMFWCFVLGCALISVIATVIIQIPASVMDAGYATTTVVSIVSLYLFIAIPGKLALGYIYDRYGMKTGILIGNTMFFLSVICLILIKHQSFLYLMAILFGSGTYIGTVSAPVITSGIFGTKYYAEIHGFLSLLPSVGYALGGLLIASAYDLTGSYSIIWIIVAILSIIMTALFLYSYRVNRVCIKEQERTADRVKNATQ